MNKLSRMIALLMLLTAATAYGTKYEYFRMTADNKTLELGDGDVAEIINYSYSESNGIRYGPTFSFLPGAASSGFGCTAEVGMRFIGLCSLELDKNMMITFRIERADTTASVDTDSNPSPPDSTSEESTDSETETAQINYDSFSNWAYFTSYPWVYNYDNKAWYYMQSTNDGLFAYNTNVSGNGWLQVGAIN
jgi:hypothetical protein